MHLGRAAHLGEVRLWGWVLPELEARVLVVDVVAHTDELLSVVGARDQDHGHAYGICLWDEAWVGCVCLQET